MKYLIVSIFLLTSFVSNSQNSGRIIHYINKCENCEIPIPESTFDKIGLNIVFPDSIYSSGDISIKKIKRDDVKLSRVKYSFENRIIQTSQFYVSKKNLSKLFTLLAENNSEINLDAYKTVFNQGKFEFSTSTILFNGERRRGKWVIYLNSILD